MYGALTISVFGSVFLRILSANFCQKKSLANDEHSENRGL